MKTDERGQATAEYSIGTLGAVLIAFWLGKFAGILGDPSSSWYGKLIHHLFGKAFGLFGGHGGDWMWRWMM